MNNWISFRCFSSSQNVWLFSLREANLIGLTPSAIIHKNCVNYGWRNTPIINKKNQNLFVSIFISRNYPLHGDISFRLCIGGSSLRVIIIKLYTLSCYNNMVPGLQSTKQTMFFFIISNPVFILSSSSLKKNMEWMRSLPISSDKNKMWRFFFVFCWSMLEINSRL